MLKRPWFWLLLIAFALRLSYGLSAHSVAGDGIHYFNLAKQISADFSYSLPLDQHHRFGALPDSAEVQPEFVRSPLYPFLMGVLFILFGPISWLTVIVNAMASTATCYLIYRIALLKFTEKAALISLAVSVFNPFLIYENKSFLVEPLFIFLMTWSLYLTFLFYRNPSGKKALLLAVVYVLTVYCKPTFLVFLIVFYTFRWGLQRDVSLWRREAIVVFVMGALLSLWTARNYVQSEGQLIPLTSALGYNLWMGTSEFNHKLMSATTKEQYYAADRAFSSEAVERFHEHPNFTDYEWDAYWKKLALNSMRVDPGLTMRLFLMKLKHFFSPFVNPFIYSARLVYVLAAFYLIHSLLFVSGLVLSFRNSDFFVQTHLLLLFSFAIFHALTLVTIRYRIPVTETVFSVFAGHGLFWMWTAARSRLLQR
jgi:4-amino-4-deoxy-L-arabinose transferase-like glycosyltransferase